MRNDPFFGLIAGAVLACLSITGNAAAETNVEPDYESYRSGGGGDEDPEDDVLIERIGGGGGGGRYNRCNQCGAACKHKCGTRSFRSCCLRLMRRKKAQVAPDYLTDPNSRFFD